MYIYSHSYFLFPITFSLHYLNIDKPSLGISINFIFLSQHHISAVCEPHREVHLSSPAVNTGMLSIIVVVATVSFFTEHNKPREEQFIGRAHVNEKANAQW